MEKKFMSLCFSNFLIAATLGLFLRFLYIYPTTGFNFKFLTHAHSHIAMLGWVYLSIQCFVVGWFIKGSLKKYKRLFWVTQLAVLGMLLSFPIQGYAAISISFSTLHIFCSYFLAYYCLKEIKPINPANKFMRWAFIFMILSTIGVWCLGPTVSQLGKSSPFYQLAIQYFLHFQFNGWFLFAVLSILLKILKIPNSSLVSKVYTLGIISTILTFAFPASWYLNLDMLYWVNVLGVILQLAMLYYLVRLLRQPLGDYLSNQNTLVKNLYRFAIFSFMIKVITQIFSCVPYIADQAHLYRNLVIGFIHLFMLGIISSLLFVYFYRSLRVSNLFCFKWGSYLFLIGIVVTELLLFTQGLIYILRLGSGLPQYYLWLFIGSAVLVVGILLLLISVLQSSVLKIGLDEVSQTT